MKKTIIIIMAALLALPALADPNEGPLEFKGIALGQSSISLQADNRFGCRQIRTTYSDEFCVLRNPSRETLGGTRIKMLSIYLYDGVVHRIAIGFDSSEFGQVKAAALQKYGTPNSTTTKELRNRAGVIFTSEKIQWNKDGGQIQINERFGRVDDAHFEISSKEAPNIFMARQKAAGGENAKDF